MSRLRLKKKKIARRTLTSCVESIGICSNYFRKSHNLRDMLTAILQTGAGWGRAEGADGKCQPEHFMAIYVTEVLLD